MGMVLSIAFIIIVLRLLKLWDALNLIEIGSYLRSNFRQRTEPHIVMILILHPILGILASVLIYRFCKQALIIWFN